MKPLPPGPLNLAQIQEYVAKMELERRFADSTTVDQALKLAEETGEVCKAVRKSASLRMDPNSTVVPAGGAASRLAPRTSPLTGKEHQHLAQVRLEQGPLTVDQARALFIALVGEPVAEGNLGLAALRADGLLTAADRDGVCADLALALETPPTPTRRPPPPTSRRRRPPR